MVIKHTVQDALMHTQCVRALRQRRAMLIEQRDWHKLKGRHLADCNTFISACDDLLDMLEHGTTIHIGE